MALLWLSMGISAWLVEQWWLRGLLLSIAAGVTIFLEKRSRPPHGAGQMEET
jgi:uncharacterized membrane protein YbaN (DUF454 family)